MSTYEGQVKIVGDDEVLEDEVFYNYKSDDAIKVIGSNNIVVRNCCSLDTSAPNDINLMTASHRDHIQLIPSSNKPLQQYALMEMTSVTIENNMLHAFGSYIQGILSTDGIHSNLTVASNLIKGSRSEHQVTFNGFMSGYIEGNRNGNGLARIKLDNARICDDHWILSFKDREYSPLSEICFDNNFDHVIDNRGKITRPYHTHLSDFDIDGFRQALSDVDIIGVKDYCLLLKKIALDFGKITRTA